MLGLKAGTTTTPSFIYVVTSISHSKVWRLENDSWELVLSFHLVDAGDQTHVTMFGSRSLHPVNHALALVVVFESVFC